MILSRLDLTAFGRFTDVTIDLSAGPKRFHVIYGPNESGKTTSLRAITSLFFGMPHAAEDCFVHRADKVRVGGLLVDPESGQVLECVRRRGRKGTLRDAADKDPIDEYLLESMLGGIQRDDFLSRFGLSYDSLVEGGQAILQGSGDLGQILFAAGAGVGRLRQIESELEQEASRLFVARGSKAAINIGLKKLDEYRLQLREVQAPTANYDRLREEVETKHQEAESLDQKLRQCVVDLKRIQSLQQALPLLPSWRSSLQGLAEVQDAPVLDEAFTERRRQVTADREIAIRQQKELRSRIDQLEVRVESIGSDPLVMSHELEIQALYREISVREKAEQDHRSLISDRKKLEHEIGDLLKDLSAKNEGGEKEAFQSIEEAIKELHIDESQRSRIHELAASHAGLVSRRNDISESLQSMKSRLVEATQEVKSMGEVADPARLVSVIEAIGNPQSEMETLLDSRQKCDALRKRCDLILQKLEGFRGDLEEAIRLDLPSDASVHKLTESLRLALHEVSQRELSLRDLQKDRELALQQLREVQANQQLPTFEELSESRRQRDALEKNVMECLLSKKTAIPAFEELREKNRFADRLADQMLEHFQQVHQCQTLSAQVQVFDARIQAAKESVATAHRDYESTKLDWDAAWNSCRVSPGQPEEMRQWLSNHEKLCDSMEQLESEEHRFEQIQSRVRLTTRRLRKALECLKSEHPSPVVTSFQSELFEDPEEDDLIAHYDEAVAARSRLLRERQDYDACVGKRDRLADELPAEQSRFEAAQQAVEAWHQDWRCLTESFASSDRTDTAEVLKVLERVNALNILKRERDSIIVKIAAIDQDQTIYSARVETVAEAIQHAPSDQPSAPAKAHAMYARLQQERSGVQSRDALREQLESCKQRLTDLASQQSEAEVALQQLCFEAGCDSHEQLPEIEARSKKRSQLDANLGELRNQLLRLCGELSLDDFIQAVEQQEEAVLIVEIEQLESRQKELRQKIDTVNRDIGAVQNELNRIDGGSRASDLAQTIQMTVGQIRSDVEIYARLKIGSKVLKRAIEHYRKENQNPVLSLANQYFEKLTCGEYGELRPDFDVNGVSTIFGVNAKGEHVPALSMSTGTADSLYLALRLASLEHQMKDGRAIPIVIDDCLVQLDDERAAAALQALSLLSEKTQVILFTHHQHLCQLASQSLGKEDFHLHQMGV